MKAKLIYTVIDTTQKDSEGRHIIIDNFNTLEEAKKHMQRLNSGTDWPEIRQFWVDMCLSWY